MSRPARRPFRLSADCLSAVNLSTVQFRKTNLVDVVLFALADSGLSIAVLDAQAPPVEPAWKPLAGKAAVQEGSILAYRLGEDDKGYTRGDPDPPGSRPIGGWHGFKYSLIVVKKD